MPFHRELIDRFAVAAERSARWFPVHLRFRQTTASVTWLDEDPTRLRVPFFDQAAAELESREPPVSKRESSTDALIETARQLSSATPLGFLFDLSRCGSIVLTDVLRATRDVSMIVEASLISSLLLPYGCAMSPFPFNCGPETRSALLESFASIYGQSKRPLIKFSGWNILAWRCIRSIWPEVPCVIITRDPVDIVAANLVMPSDWMHWRTQSALTALQVFDWFALNVAAMPAAEYCARAVGEFCRGGNRDAWERLHDASI